MRLPPQQPQTRAGSSEGHIVHIAHQVNDADDIVHLMRNVDYMTLRRASSGLRLLRGQAHAVEAWRDFIPLYRSVRCQPLDFFYAYLQCLGAFDEPLLEDLLTACTWRGGILGSWLLGFCPPPHLSATPISRP